MAAYSIIESARIFEGAPQLPACCAAAAALHHDCAAGMKGNLTESPGPMGVFLFFCLLSAFASFYLFHWQVFVLRLDRILNIICFAFVGLEFFLGIFATVGFNSG